MTTAMIGKLMDRKKLNLRKAHKDRTDSFHTVFLPDKKLVLSHIEIASLEKNGKAVLALPPTSTQFHIQLLKYTRLYIYRSCEILESAS